MAELCTDNRFELIEKYKQELLDATNIEDSPDEMAVIDNILFRFWQMGWLTETELPSVQKTGRWSDDRSLGILHHRCSECGNLAWKTSAYCPNCGARMESE